MNTIPLIFNERQIKRTILGGQKSSHAADMSVSAILLNHASNPYRDSLLESLVKSGFSSIISIEPSEENYQIKHLSRKFPSVTFIILHETVSSGEMINIAISETTEDYALVLRDTLKLNPQFFTPRIFQRVVESGVFCTVPRLLSRDLRALPTRFSPTIANKHFSVDISAGLSDNAKTLYPLDNIALYQRKKFIQLGGYDYTITAPYWQNLDFSLRAWLWGEEIQLSPLMQFAYEADVSVENTTADISSLRFYLKNLAPVVRVDHGYIPVSSFFGYWKLSRSGFFYAKKQFADARDWVETNKYRFKFDAQSLINSWNVLMPEGNIP